MSNEELAVLIQTGARDKLPELWEQVERFVAVQARRQIRILKGIGGVESEDLYQSGYIALVAAADSYDPAAGRSFVSWMALHLKKTFASAGGYQTRKQARDPLHCAGSLDAPLGDGESDLTLGDTVEDPFAAEAFERAEGRIWEGQLKDQTEKALDAIPPELAETVRDKYYLGKTVDNKAHSAAIRSLRHPNVSRNLRQFL